MRAGAGPLPLNHSSWPIVDQQLPLG